MCDITYEQFEFWCKHWNMTTEEGFKAMCFTANIIGQNFGNCVDYAHKVSDDDSHSDAFKKVAKKFKDDAIILSTLYGRLDNMVYDMLEKHDKEEN